MSITQTRARRGVSGGRARNVDLLGADDASGMEQAWLDLYEHAVEANPFFSPFMLLPALRRLGASGVGVLCISEDEKLIGLAPVRTQHGYGRLPARYQSVFTHAHCFYGAPLVRRGAETAVVEELFDFADRTTPSGGFLRLPLLDLDGPVAQAVMEGARARGRLAYSSGAYERALLRGGYRAPDFIRENVRKKKLKELRRLRKRLSEYGALNYEMLPAGADPGPWLADFLYIEHESWKGAAGTSLQSRTGEAAFFREAAESAARVGALQIARIALDGAPIAMMVNFGVKREGYRFKICHDPQFARFSPGVLLELEFLEAQQGMGPEAFMDSCARADHPMINSLWPDRRRIGGINIATAGAASAALLRLCRFIDERGDWARRK